MNHDVVESGGKALARGTYSAVESIGSAGEMLGIPGGEELSEWGGEKAQQPGLAKPRWLEEGTVVDHPERLTDVEWWVNLGLENLPNMAAMMIPGATAYKGAKLLGAGAKTALKIGTGGAMAGAFTIESGAAFKEAFDDMIKQGYTEDKAKEVARVEGVVVGIANSLLEVAPFNILFANPGSKKLLGRVIRQGLWEGGTEAIQENVNMLVAEMGHAPDVSLKEKVGRTIES